MPGPRLWCAVLAMVATAACGSPARPSASEPPPTLPPGGLVEATPTTLQRVVEASGGRPTVVNFWATWCGPCTEEMPRLVAAARRYGDRVRFIGVDVEDTDGAARRFIKEYRIPFPSLADPKGEIRRDQEVVGLPTTQFYRADGELAFVHSGEISTEQLEDRLSELVEIGRPPLTPKPEPTAD